MPLAKIFLCMVALCAPFLCSCSTTYIRHVSVQSKTPVMQDSLSRQLLRAHVELQSNGRLYERKPGFIRLANDTFYLRSSILYDTLKISLDSVQRLTCYERLPWGTIIAATAGGAAAGFVVSKVTAQDHNNSQLPVGLSVIGGLMGGFTAWISDRETLYIIDPKERSAGEAAPLPRLTPPQKK